MHHRIMVTAGAWGYNGHEFSASPCSSAVLNHLWEPELLEAVVEEPQGGPWSLAPTSSQVCMALKPQRSRLPPGASTGQPLPLIGRVPPSLSMWTQVSLPSLLPLKPLFAYCFPQDPHSARRTQSSPFPPVQSSAR